MSPAERQWPILRRQGGGGVPLALLHGFLGDKEDWQGLLAELPETFAALAFDLPGHGGAGARRDMPSWSQTLAELDWQRQRLGLASWHLLGYSLGGRLALHYALTYPGRVASLTLLSASPGIGDPAARQARVAADARWAERFRREPLAEVLSDWYRQGVFASLRRQPTLLAALLARRGRLPSRPLAEVIDRWGQGVVPSVWDRLGELATLPRQLLVGREDAAYCQHGERLRQASSPWQVVVLENCGHTLHLERPKQVAAILAPLLLHDNNDVSR
jgi:2-succinyl-6-hydroxy-2,4-cyclohexadiene-1-carboxylate synthase